MDDKLKDSFEQSIKAYDNTHKIQDTLYRSAQKTLAELDSYRKCIEQLNGPGTIEWATRSVNTLEQLTRDQQLISSASRDVTLLEDGSLATLQRLADFDGSATEALRNTENSLQLLNKYESLFCLPKEIDSLNLATELSSTILAETVRRFHDDSAELIQAMQTMHSPWLNEHNKVDSIYGFAALHGIGHALTIMNPYEEYLVTALRTDLGDWHNTFNIPDAISTDIPKRLKFYAKRGFNNALTDFPSTTFQEIICLTGLSPAPSALYENYALPITPSEHDEGKKVSAKNNKAYNALIYLENNIRSFIDYHMIKNFGSDWTKHRMPNGMYDQGSEKKKKYEQRRGESLPLIKYADFTDYERIICKGDNWNVLFLDIFCAKTLCVSLFVGFIPFG